MARRAIIVKVLCWVSFRSKLLPIFRAISSNSLSEWALIVLYHDHRKLSWCFLDGEESWENVRWSWKETLPGHIWIYQLRPNFRIPKPIPVRRIIEHKRKEIVKEPQKKHDRVPLYTHFELAPSAR